MLIQRNKDLGAETTLRLRARAQAYVALEDRAQLPELLPLMDQHTNWQVLAGGSNVVLGEQLGGLTIGMHTQGVHLLGEDEHEYLVAVEAGENWHQFVEYCLQQGWYGLENLALIPGTVGAAPVQNIGAYGVEVRQFIRWVEAWDSHGRTLRRLNAAQCQFSYRDSVFKRSGPGRWIILRVAFAFPKQWQPVLDYPDLQPLANAARPPEPGTIFSAVSAVRQAKLPDPAQLPNAGSFFKNPVVSAAQAKQIKQQWPDVRAFEQEDGSVKLAAGWLIEQAGWKGQGLGPVGMHDRQALVLVNHAAGEARLEDVARLTRRIRADIRRLYGVALEQEPVQLGARPL